MSSQEEDRQGPPELWKRDEAAIHFRNYLFYTELVFSMEGILPLELGGGVGAGSGERMRGVHVVKPIVFGTGESQLKIFWQTTWITYNHCNGHISEPDELREFLEYLGPYKSST